MKSDVQQQQNVENERRELENHFHCIYYYQKLDMI